MTLAARFTFWHKIFFSFELNSSLFVYIIKRKLHGGLKILILFFRGEKQYFTRSQFLKKILVSSTQQQILSTCFIFSDRFRLIIQTSSGSLNKIHKGTYFIPMLWSTNHVPTRVRTAKKQKKKNTYRFACRI